MDFNLPEDIVRATSEEKCFLYGLLGLGVSEWLDLYLLIEQYMHSIVITDTTISDSKTPLILYVNEKWQQMTCYSSSEVIGESPKIIRSPSVNAITMAKMRQCILDKIPFIGSDIMQNKQGKVFMMEWNIIFTTINKKEVFISVQKKL